MPVAGVDGKVPIYNPDGLWQMWSIADIYMGQEGLNKHVPKINDYVVNPQTGEQWRVTAVDETTFVPTLTPIQIVPIEVVDTEDRLISVGPGAPDERWRAYIDRSVIPHTLAVDHYHVLPGAQATYCKIFRGATVGNDGVEVSAVYDSSMNLLGTEVPLTLVATTGTNVAMKTVPTCHTTVPLEDGEVVTVVFYSATAAVVAKRQLVVQNTAFVRGLDASVKYILSIALESPFLSESDPDTILFPMNVPLSGIPMTGVVTYSDGSVARLPVDGSKFSVFGLTNYLSTVVGQRLPLTLKYTLSPGEIIYNATSATFKTEDYFAVTTNPEGVYEVKLYGFPVWIDAVQGYRMEWFLYNLDRDISYNVTQHVTYSVNTPAFMPLAYGTQQDLHVSVNLNSVNGAYKVFNHSQIISVTLLGPTDGTGTPWSIKFDPGQDPVFGNDNEAVTVFTNINNSQVRVDCGAATQADWLQRLYRQTKPMVDPAREVDAPEPTHFLLLVGGQELEYPISQWNATITLDTFIPNRSTLFIKFIKKTLETNIQLAVAGVSVKQVVSY